MIETNLLNIADGIREFNPIYHKSFIAAKRDDKGDNITHVGEKIIFPADNMGNYFYIRDNSPISWTDVGTKQIPCTLVSYTMNTSKYIMLSNLEHTIANFNSKSTSAKVKFDYAITDAIDVINREIPKDRLDKAKKNLPKNATLILINFILILPPIIGTKRIECFPDPYKKC